MKPTKTALEFMKENHYRNCGDRTCANCANCRMDMGGKMKCSAPGPDPDGFQVFRFGICDAYEKRNTGQITGGLPRKSDKY